MPRLLHLFVVCAVLAWSTGCKSHTFTVAPPSSPTAVDPDVPECTGSNPASLIKEHLADLQQCTDHLGCRTNHVRTITLMLGCNGTQGALYVLSHKDLSAYNECMVERSASWDFSGVCSDPEGECAWTYGLEIECEVQ